MKTLDDCYNRGPKKINSDPDSARKCLITAAGHLDDAEASFAIKRYRLALTSSYEVMFHAAKACFSRTASKSTAMYACRSTSVKRIPSLKCTQIRWTRTGFTVRKPPTASI